MEISARRRKVMWRDFTPCLAGAALVLASLGPPSVLADVICKDALTLRDTQAEADALIQQMEDLTRADTNVSTYRMQVIRPGDNREFRVRSWDDRTGERSFIHILAPRRDADTTFLKVGGNLWIYLPRLERAIKIPPAMMLNSWMGSDFTNDDIVRESSAINDYTNTIRSREPGPKGTELVTIESIPHRDAPVVWGKVVAKIRSDGIPVRQQFYDEDGELVRTMRFEAVATLGGRTMPTRLVMIPEDQENHSTILTIEDAIFGEPIADDVFTRVNLSRRR